MSGRLASGIGGILWSASLVIAAATVGCEPGRNSLGGSVGESYDLGFDTTRARLYSSELSIEYVRESGEVPVRVVLDRRGGSIETGTYRLEERGSVDGRVEQNRLPDLESGELILQEFEGRSGAPIRGRFSAELEAAGDDESTLSLRGQFSTTLEVVDQHRGYRFGRDTGDTGDVGDADAESDS